MQPLRLCGHLFYVKRDDLIHPAFSGNKFRKLQSLIDTPAERYDTLVSYGGVQSNAMLSLAHLAAMKGWRFRYWVKGVPKTVARRPEGNYAQALRLGMEMESLGYEKFYEKIQKARSALTKRSLFVPQGGADPIAEAGVARLAEEIEAWRRATGLDRLGVVTPSGTGTTALYLRRHLPKTVAVYTVPVVGDETILHAQWRRLALPGEALPTVLPYTPHPFAKPRPDYLRIWRALAAAGVVFDLIYAPPTWLALLAAYERLVRPVLYVHSGGITGNGTQLDRYRRGGMWEEAKQPRSRGRNEPFIQTFKSKTVLQ